MPAPLSWSGDQEKRAGTLRSLGPGTPTHPQAREGLRRRRHHPGRKGGAEREGWGGAEREGAGLPGAHCCAGRGIARAGGAGRGRAGGGNRRSPCLCRRCRCRQVRSTGSSGPRVELPHPRATPRGCPHEGCLCVARPTRPRGPLPPRPPTLRPRGRQASRGVASHCSQR